MRVEKDFVDLLESFNKNKVKYCIIGAFAVGFWGYPRYTKDIDIIVEPTAENAEKIMLALKEFGANLTDLSEDDFKREHKIVQLGVEPVRIDILTSIEGVSFKDIWENKKTGDYGKQKVFFMGRDELIKSKKKADRDSDKIDIGRLLKRRS